MSLVSVSSAGARPMRHELAVPFGLLVATFFLFVGGNLAGNGVLALMASTSRWRSGSLLEALALWIAGWFGAVLDGGTALVLVYVVVAAGAAVAAFRSLRTNDWPTVQAFFVLALVAGHGMMLQAVTSAAPEFFVVLAAALLIPAARRLEAVGDVQAIINFGLVLPVLVMAGPPLLPLIPLLVLAVPLREGEARRRPGVFGAMLLVSAVPPVILVLGVWAIAARSGLGINALAAPFVAAFERGDGDALPMLALAGFAAPVAAVPLIHMLVPDRRRKVWTSLLTLLLPVYLAAGNAWFSWGLAFWTPAAALLAMTLGWLAATRVRPWLRWGALALLLASLVGGWALRASWADKAWLDGLMPIQLYGHSFAVPSLGAGQASAVPTLPMS